VAGVVFGGKVSTYCRSLKLTNVNCKYNKDIHNLQIGSKIVTWMAQVLVTRAIVSFEDPWSRLSTIKLPYVHSSSSKQNLEDICKINSHCHY